MFLPVLGRCGFLTHILGRLDDLEAFGGRSIGGRTRTSGSWRRNRVRLRDGRHRCRVLCGSTKKKKKVPHYGDVSRKKKNTYISYSLTRFERQISAIKVKLSMLRRCKRATL
ncbi:unnamed protein product [Lasius platythorax]|uniref:Uncharacterized protein n=1 Tax=Lasius platythorax TaxID=488582 RepID=A0AAV2P4E6_9HYME